MNQLWKQIDFVIGVDTHKHTHTSSVVNRHGAELASIQVAADASGYQRLMSFADRHAQQARVWAIEGAGNYGSGLTRLLLGHGERVVEIDRPARPARRNEAKSDRLDAARAAREALARVHLAEPRARLRALPSNALVKRCARLRSVETQVAVRDPTGSGGWRPKSCPGGRRAETRRPSPAC